MPVTPLGLPLNPVQLAPVLLLTLVALASLARVGATKYARRTKLHHIALLADRAGAALRR